MTILQFIEKAIEGGWKLRGSEVSVFRRGRDLRFQHDGYTEAVNEPEILLDPAAWQAVGKVEGWPSIGTADLPQSHHSVGWVRNMHRMIDALAEGEAIENFLETL